MELDAAMVSEKGRATNNPASNPKAKNTFSFGLEKIWVGVFIEFLRIGLVCSRAELADE